MWTINSALLYVLLFKKNMHFFCKRSCTLLTKSSNKNYKLYSLNQPILKKKHGGTKPSIILNWNLTDMKKKKSGYIIRYYKWHKHMLAAESEPICRHSFWKSGYFLLTGCCRWRWCLACCCWAEMWGWALTNFLYWLCVSRIFCSWHASRHAETGNMHWQNNNQISCSNTTCRSCQRAWCLLRPCYS